jgi:hypothetical protein
MYLIEQGANYETRNRNFNRLPAVYFVGFRQNQYLVVHRVGVAIHTVYIVCSNRMDCSPMAKEVVTMKLNQWYSTGEWLKMPTGLNPKDTVCVVYTDSPAFPVQTETLRAADVGWSRVVMWHLVRKEPYVTAVIHTGPVPEGICNGLTSRGDFWIDSVGNAFFFTEFGSYRTHPEFDDFVVHSSVYKLSMPRNYIHAMIDYMKSQLKK